MLSKSTVSQTVTNTKFIHNFSSYCHTCGGVGAFLQKSVCGIISILVVYFCKINI